MVHIIGGLWMGLPRGGVLMGDRFCWAIFLLSPGLHTRSRKGPPEKNIINLLAEHQRSIRNDINIHLCEKAEQHDPE